jgi:hypothetical protein
MSNELPIPQWDQLPGLTWTEKVAYLTHQFLTMEQTECPLQHQFEKGLYIREIRIPADVLIVGRIHRHGHVCQLLEGSLVLIHREGHQEAFQAPSEILTLPGYQMVLYTATPVVARTIHPNPTDSRDISMLEADIFESAESVKELGAALHREVLS